MVVLSSMESSGSGTYLTQLVRGVYIEGIPWTGEEVDNYLERYRHTRPKVSVVTRDTIRSICSISMRRSHVLEAVRGNVHNQAMKAVLRGGENCPLLWDLGTHTSDGGDTKVNIKKTPQDHVHTCTCDYTIQMHVTLI